MALRKFEIAYFLTLCTVIICFVMKIAMAAMEGPLSKWTNLMNGWQYRWFVLDENIGLLSYYTVSTDPNAHFTHDSCIL